MLVFDSGFALVSGIPELVVCIGGLGEGNPRSFSGNAAAQEHHRTANPSFRAPRVRGVFLQPGQLLAHPRSFGTKKPRAEPVSETRAGGEKPLAAALVKWATQASALEQRAAGYER